MEKQSLNWKVAGFAGEGIMTTGILFSKTCARHGLYIFDYTEYPSLIRGGHNTYQVYADTNPVHSQRKKVDILIALNKNSLSFHQDELTQNSLVIYDQEDDKVNIKEFALPCKSFNLPMVKLAKVAGAERVMGNNVALGASIFLLGLNLEILNQVISDIFSKKGNQVVSLNQQAAKAGYEFAKIHSQPILTAVNNKPHNYLTLTGNESIGLGAVAGGVKLYTAYPMTPSSSILHYLAAKAKKSNIVVKHAEDEIGAINMALGSSFTGARSMVGTSGGGLCYMTEAFGLSGIAEIPLVVVDAMRPGPALGMPTWTAQGDLQFVLTASQDEFPRIVMAPGDVFEAFDLTRRALELAEKYQTIVILLTDKYLSESRHTLKLDNESFNNQRIGFSNNPKPDESGFFPRYQDSENGVSSRSVPGSLGGTYIANSYEHDNYGFATEVADIRNSQVEKRARKLTAMAAEIPEQFYIKENNAALTFISFGSTKGPLLATKHLLKDAGININILNLSWMWPFPKDQVTKVIKESSKPVVIEGNQQGQLARLITQETGIIINDKLNRYDGRPFYPEDIASYVRKIVK